MSHKEIAHRLPFSFCLNGYTPNQKDFDLRRKDVMPGEKVNVSVNWTPQQLLCWCSVRAARSGASCLQR